MIVGQPLHYYYPYGQSPPLVETAFPYFQQFERLATPMDPNEDYPMITSPSNSTQVNIIFIFYLLFLNTVFYCFINLICYINYISPEVLEY